MYQPKQIAQLPTLSEEEKSKYTAGLQGLWNKANSLPPDSDGHIAARQKIIEFSKMLIVKIQQRRSNQVQPKRQAADQQATDQQDKIPDHILQHVNKLNFQAPPEVAEKFGADADEWVEEIKKRYERALVTMDDTRHKVAQIDKLINDRAADGHPFKEDELRQLQIRKEQQLKAHSNAHKWVDSVRKQQGILQLDSEELES
jgi:transcription initiation factor TFIID subunit 12